MTLGLLVIGTATLTSAGAAPYPPPNPCGSSAGAGNDPGACVLPTEETRSGSSASSTPVRDTSDDATASTGFDTLTASLIAAVLLVGGGALIVSSRRHGRKHG